MLSVRSRSRARAPFAVRDKGDGKFDQTRLPAAVIGHLNSALPIDGSRKAGRSRKNQARTEPAMPAFVYASGPVVDLSGPVDDTGNSWPRQSPFGAIFFPALSKR